MSRFAAAVLILLYTACGKPDKIAVEDAYAVHCGSCHLPPEIGDLPRSLWTKSVMPDMAARLGISIPGYDPYANMSYEERLAVFETGIYPSTPVMDPSLYDAIWAYIEGQAPAALQPLTETALLPLENYRLHRISYPEDRLPSFTYLKIGAAEIEAGDLKGNLAVYKMKQKQWDFAYRFESPVVDFAQKDSLSWALVVGLLDPSERAFGQLLEIDKKEQRILKDSLHRPVNLHVSKEEAGYSFYISEFGHLTGRLSRLSQWDNELSYKPLMGTPGALRTKEVDIDGDSIPEKLVLFAQGDERLIALSGNSDESPTYNTLLRFSPLSGVSWFETADLDGDGDLDLITAHGDNADNTYVLKPYHGIRIHSNDGTGQFSEVYRFPMYGATRVATLDWDMDGDPDLACVAAFPDYAGDPVRSFVLLENHGSDSGTWIPKAFPEMNDGRWFLMDAADMDGDGDEDLVLGVFNYHITPVPETLLEHWKKEEIALLILENTSL